MTLIFNVAHAVGTAASGIHHAFVSVLLNYNQDIKINYAEVLILALPYL
jgi:hypothetical protein